jgi:hypothetical protein
LELWLRNSFSGNICFEFSAFVSLQCGSLEESQGDQDVQPRFGPDVRAVVGPDIGPAVDTVVGSDIGHIVGTDVGTDIGHVVGTDVGPDIGHVVGTVSLALVWVTLLVMSLAPSLDASPGFISVYSSMTETSCRTFSSNNAVYF